MKIYLQLKETSQPIIYERMSDVYQKGEFICVSYLSPTGEKWTDKYPIQNVWRIRQPYGYHSMPDPKLDRE